MTRRARRQAVLLHLDEVYRVARCLAADHEVAERLVQQTYDLALRRLDDPGSGGSSRSWLVSLLRQVFLVDHGGAPPEILVSDKDRRALVALAEGADPSVDASEVLLGLPWPTRLAIWLCDVEGFGHFEAAVACGVDVTQLRLRLHRGRGVLARRARRRWRPAHSL